MVKLNKQLAFARRTKRTRAKIKGTAERPRLSIFRSNQAIYAQLIDDVKGVTIAATSSLKEKEGSNLAAAQKVGAGIAKEAAAKKIKTVVFDRAGYLYHGRVKALADAAREAGLQF